MEHRVWWILCLMNSESETHRWQKVKAKDNDLLKQIQVKLPLLGGAPRGLPVDGYGPGLGWILGFKEVNPCPVPGKALGVHEAFMQTSVQSGIDQAFFPSLERPWTLVHVCPNFLWTPSHVCPNFLWTPGHVCLYLKINLQAPQQKPAVAVCAMQPRRSTGGPFISLPSLNSSLTSTRQEG